MAESQVKEITVALYLGAAERIETHGVRVDVHVTPRELTTTINDFEKTLATLKALKFGMDSLEASGNGDA